MKKLIPLATLFFMGCSTSPYKAYESFPVGGDKAALLDEVGSPIRTKRKDGLDVWTYRFYDGDTKIYRDVHLRDGKVVFKGENQEAREAEIEEKVEEGIKKSKPGIPVNIEKYKDKVDKPMENLNPENK